MKVSVHDWASTRRKSSPSSIYFVYSDVAMVMSRPSFGDIKPPMLLLYHISHMVDDRPMNLWRPWKRSLIGGFPQARLADVINQTRPTGPGNQRTTQFSYKSDLSLSMTLKTEEVCVFMCLSVHYIIFIYVFIRFSTKTGTYLFRARMNLL